MADGLSINFQDSEDIVFWLDTALDQEKKKFEQVPIEPDLVPEYLMIQGWGYVIAAYSLMEQSFKALLHVQAKPVPQKHSLSMLFNLFDTSDKDILRTFYTDFKATAKDPLKSFSYESLDEFLTNLDGDPSKGGRDHIGSFDWRYFPIEKARSQKMPAVSIDYMHEIIYGCIRMVYAAIHRTSDATKHLKGLRMHHQRWIETHRGRLMARVHTEGWKELGARLEVLWGPDDCGRYDFIIHNAEGGGTVYFDELPEGHGLPIHDVRRPTEAATG